MSFTLLAQSYEIKLRQANIFVRDLSVSTENSIFAPLKIDEEC